MPEWDSATSLCGSKPASTHATKLERDCSSGVQGYASFAAVGAASSSSSSGELGDSRSIGKETASFFSSSTTYE